MQRRKWVIDMRMKLSDKNCSDWKIYINDNPTSTDDDFNNFTRAVRHAVLNSRTVETEPVPAVKIDMVDAGFHQETEALRGFAWPVLSPGNEHATAMRRIFKPVATAKKGTD